MQLVTAFSEKPKDWLAAGGREKKPQASRENNIIRRCDTEISDRSAALCQTRGKQ